MAAPLAHHDGSPRFVSSGSPSVGEPVVLRVLVAEQLAASRVVLRVVEDGEPQRLECLPVEAPDGRAGEQWWQVELPLANHRVNYRFLIECPDGVRVLNQRGVFRREVPDANDFRLTADPPVPQWALDGVFYQVFPDRFARAAAEAYPHELPSWAVAAQWTTPVAAETPDGVRQFYGGTLWGIVERLDHLQHLGTTAIYLTPFFPAQSNHRYDSTTFDMVDPLLGGDEALRALTAAARDRGIRVIGDLTLNHTGVAHEWFRTAQQHPDSAEHDFYLFEDDPTGPGYACFWNAPSLPKLDHRSQELRRRLYDGPDSVVTRYVREFGLSGWRIDVAQAAGIHRDVDLRSEVARLTRRTLDELAAERGEGCYLVAEFNHDASFALQGDGWQGSMAYANFSKPVWSWLTGEVSQQWGSPIPMGRIDGVEMAAQMDDHNALVPWRSRVAGMSLLGSHDTARVRTSLGREGQLLGTALMMTMPGIPMLFSGDEVGVEGSGMEDGRRPFPWDGPQDDGLLAAYRELIALRHQHAALREGGFRWLDVQPDAVVFERATRDERLLVQVARAEHPEPFRTPWQLESLHQSAAGAPTLAAGELLPGNAGHRVWRIA